MSMFKRHVLLLLILLPVRISAYDLSGEIAVSQKTLGPAADAQHLVGAASDGTDFLVVWSDGRKHPDGGVRYTVITDEGQRRFSSGRVIPGISGLGAAAVFFNGSEYVVFLLGADRTSNQLAAQRISRDGALLGPAQYLHGNFRFLDVAWNGTTFLVLGTPIFDASAETYPIHAFFFSPDLRLLRGPVTLPISTKYSLGRTVAVASGEAEFLVVLESAPDRSREELRALRISETAAVLAESGVLVSDLSLYLYDALGTPGGYLLRWRAFDSNTYVLPLDLELKPRSERAAVAKDYAYIGSLVPVDGGYVASVGNCPDTSLDLLFVDQFATPQEVASTFLQGSSCWYPADAVRSERRILFLWETWVPSHDPTHDIRFLLTDANRRPADGENHPGEQVALSQPAQDAPSIAFDGTQYLVVWRQGYDDEGTEIRAARIDLEGRPKDGEGLLLAPRGDGPPKVTFDGRNFVIVWRGSDTRSFSVVGLRVDRDGRPLDDEPFGIADTPSVDYDISSNGRGSLVVAETAVEDTFGLHALRIGQDGELLDRVPPRIFQGRAGAPAVASDGDGYLAVAQGLMRAARISADGQVSAPVTLEAGQRPDVAWGNGSFLLTWNAGSNLWARRLDRNGAPLESASIVATPTANGDATVHLSDVAFDGRNFVLVWDRSRGFVPLPPPIFSGYPSTILHFTDVDARLLNTAGDPLDMDGGFPISATSGDERDASLFSFGGRTAIVYARDVLDDDAGVPRVFLRFLERDLLINRPLGR
jgi:hypothetical protein